MDESMVKLFLHAKVLMGNFLHQGTIKSSTRWIYMHYWKTQNWVESRWNFHLSRVLEFSALIPARCTFSIFRSIILREWKLTRDENCTHPFFVVYCVLFSTSSYAQSLLDAISHASKFVNKESNRKLLLDASLVSQQRNLEISFSETNLNLCNASRLSVRQAVKIGKLQHHVEL